MRNITIRFIALFLLSTLSLSAKDSFLVAIDIGHTPKKYGCMSSRGISEYRYNRRMALELHSALSSSNINSFVINQVGDDISLLSRTAEAKRRGASLFISIHHDSVQPKFLSKWDYEDKTYRYSDNFYGYSLFVSTRNKNAKKNLLFANLLGEALIQRKNTPTLHHALDIKGERRTLLSKERGVYLYDTLAVLRTAKMPALLMECGVIVNRKEELLLNYKAYRENMINAIVEAVFKFNNI